MKNLKKILKYLLVIVFISWGQAQQSLIINGYLVEGLNTNLIQDTPYISAELYASVLGARFSYSEQMHVANLEIAGKLLSIRVYESAAQAAGNTNALSLNNEPLYSTGGILSSGMVYLPVQPIALALGSNVDYLAETKTVVVASSRANLTIERQGSAGSQFERFVIKLTESVPVEEVKNVALGVARYRFDRTDVVAEQRFVGDYFEELLVRSLSGQVEVLINLKNGSDVDMYTVAGDGQGFSVILDVLPTETKAQRHEELQPQSLAETATPFSKATQIVIDPGHGGTDSGFYFASNSNESALTLNLAQQLRDSLNLRGYNSVLTREGDFNVSLETRNNAGVGAALFVSLHAENLPKGQFNLYYLGDAERLESLNLAIRQNAETEVNSSQTDRLRRQILLQLVPNVELGKRLARNFERIFVDRSGYRLAHLEALPLFILSGAAGRGILLEFSYEDLLTPKALSETLADALISLTKQP